MKPIVCVRHQESAPLGIIEPVLAASNVEWRYLDAWSDADVPDVSDLSGLIVLGGEMNADDLANYPFLVGVRDLVKDTLDADVPMLGICLGAQVLTRALDGEVTRAPVREIGFLPVKATEAGMEDPILAPFAPTAEVFQFHEDECHVPDHVDLLLEGEDVRVQAFKAGSAYGVQFHFEVTEEIVAAWCDEVPDLADEWGKTKAEVMEEARHGLGSQLEAGRATTRAFLDLVRDAH